MKPQGRTPAFDLAVGCILVERQAEQDQKAGHTEQAEMLKAVAATLRERIVAEVRPSGDEKDLYDWPMMRHADGTSGEAWPAFVLEELGGRPEYRDLIAGKLPVLSERFYRTSRHILQQFRGWLADKTIGRR